MYRAQPSDWLLGTQRKPGVLAPEEVLDSLPFFRIRTAAKL
jgi:hypothetical protein